jgi:Flp pilus assembly protein TadD
MTHRANQEPHAAAFSAPPTRLENLASSSPQGRQEQSLVDQGRALLEAGDLEGALSRFQAASEADADHARARSYLGLALALSQRRFAEAVDLCTSAAKQEFFNPEVYHNLARVYLAFGFKTEGRRFLLRGLMIDPGNETIQSALEQLGKRSDPVLSFLPRRHILNRWLGSARCRTLAISIT